MKRKKCRAFSGVVLTLGLCAGMFLSGCGKEETSVAADEAEETEISQEAEISNEYAAISGVYQTKIFMSEDNSVDLFMNISDDGNFIFSRDDNFESTEKGAGVLGKTEGWKDAFFYTELNGEEVKHGDRVATFTVDENGGIQFTSPMWFGSTEPKYTGADGAVSYPNFLKYDPKNPPVFEPPAENEQEEEISGEDVILSEQSEDQTPPPSNNNAANQEESAANQESVAQNEAPAAVQTAEPEPVENSIDGTYTGSFTKYVDAMESNVSYSITLTLRGGSYDYTVNINLSGNMDYSGTESYSGTYSVNGDSLSMTGMLSSGTIYGSSLTVTGLLSSFASSAESVSLFK